MPVSFDGISNLSPDFQKAFQTAITMERRPIQQLETRKEGIQQKVQVMDELVGKVEGLRKLLPTMNSPVAIRELALNTDDPKVITGTADKSLAEPGKHSLEVIQLASSASALSNGFTDKDETRIGTGYLVFETVSGEEKEVFIDYENSTLEAIATTINKAHTGMRAAVITDSSDSEAPYKLMLYADSYGAASDVQFPEFYFAGGEEDFYLDSERDAQNAIINYQGYQIESATNEIKDLIPGATLNLKGITDPGKPATVTIEQDIPKTVVKVKDLVEKLNQTFSFLQQNQAQLGDKVPSNKPLAGDYGIRMTEDRLRNALRENFLLEEDSTRVIRSLTDLGIQFQKNGTLAFDEKRLEHALSANFEETIDLLAGDSQNYGVITKLSQALTSIGGGNRGMITSERQNYVNQLQTLDRKIEEREKRLEAKAESLKNQLAKAQSALNSIQSQGSLFGGAGGT